MGSYMTKYFAAANTESGFFSLFDEIFPPEKWRRIYILKGGPGTGKSTLMRDVGNAAEQRGYDAEYYFCSSDTESLDGVTIPSLGVAVIDGTAPHMTDPCCPGAVERIVNLGDAFDFGGLEASRDRLMALSSEKRDVYRTAYRYLFAAGRLTREVTATARAAFLEEKADAAVSRLFAACKQKKKGSACHRYLSAIGTHGLCSLDTLRLRADKTYVVTDKCGLGYLFLNKLRSAFEKEGVAMTICETPLVREQTEAIFLEGENALFFVADPEDATECDKCINISRFINKNVLCDHRGMLRFSEKCISALMEGALSALAKAGAIHSQMEDIYGAHIDFSLVNTMKDRMLSEIFVDNMKKIAKGD